MLYVNVNKLHSHVVQAIRASDGQLLWQYVADSRLAGAPVIEDGVIYVGVGGGIDEANICALRASDGTLLWKYTIGSDEVEAGEFVLKKRFSSLRLQWPTALFMFPPLLIPH